MSNYLHRLPVTYDPEALLKDLPDSFRDYGDTILFERQKDYPEEAKRIIDKLQIEPSCASYTVNIGNIEWHSHGLGETNIIFPLQGSAWTLVDEFYDVEDEDNLVYHERYGYHPAHTVLPTVTLWNSPGLPYLLDTSRMHAVQYEDKLPRYCFHLQMLGIDVTEEDFKEVEDEMMKHLYGPNIETKGTIK